VFLVEFIGMRRAIEQPARRLVLGDHRRRDALHDVALATQRREELGAPGADQPLEQRVEHRALVGEIGVERGLGDPGCCSR